MKPYLILSSIIALLPGLALPAAEFGAVPDPFTGNWSGTRVANAREEPMHATVIEFKDGYAVTFRAQPDPRAEAIVIFKGTVRRNGLVLEPSLSEDRSEVIEVQPGGVLIKTLLWEGRGNEMEMKGAFAGYETGTFSLRKIPFQPSPTLGTKAPAGAVVLFDGADLEAWQSKQAPMDAIQWIVADSGALEVVSQRDGKRNKQDLRTKESFGDYHLHLEFKLAHKPEATGQGRSNSGIFHLGLYETQILDSFGLYGYDNECGGIYKTRAPDSNAAYPAGLWQTYDIEVQAPRSVSVGRSSLADRC